MPLLLTLMSGVLDSKAPLPLLLTNSPKDFLKLFRIPVAVGQHINGPNRHTCQFDQTWQSARMIIVVVGDDDRMNLPWPFIEPIHQRRRTRANIDHDERLVGQGDDRAISLSDIPEINN